MAEPSYAKLRPVYRQRWNAASPAPKWRAAADRFMSLIYRNRARYVSVQEKTGVPWYFIAAAHMRESSCDFRGVLHNGEHIIGKGLKTTLVPRNRGPFKTWEEAAIDALRLHGLHNIRDWPIERVLYELERFNGWGYFYKGRISPYVWSGTTLYRSGKYIADGVYDASHVDSQLGCAIILKRLESDGIAVDATPAPQDAPAEPAPLPPEPKPDIRESPSAQDPATKPAVQSKTIWASIGGILATIGGALTDWRVAAVIVVFIFALIIADRYLKLDIRGWFR